MTSGKPPQSVAPIKAWPQSPLPRGSARAPNIMSLTVLPCVGL